VGGWLGAETGIASDHDAVEKPMALGKFCQLVSPRRRSSEQKKKPAEVNLEPASSVTRL